MNKIVVQGKIKVIRFVLGLTYDNRKFTDDEKLLFKGLYFFLEEEYQEARQCFEEAYRLNPSNYHAIHNLAVMTDNEVLANQYREEAKRINPLFYDEFQRRLGNQFETSLINTIEGVFTQ